MDEGDSGRKREAPQDSGPVQKKKRLFIRELKYMMHGFGDDPNPHTGNIVICLGACDLPVYILL